MADQQDGSRTQVHYGVRQTGTDEVGDYWSDLDAAAQAATLPGWELVRWEVTTTPCVVIPSPLKGHSEPSGSQPGATEKR